MSQIILTNAMREEIFEMTIQKAKDQRHSCKWCHGRGYEGTDVKTGRKVVCRKIMAIHKRVADAYIKRKVKEAQDGAKNPTVQKLGEPDSKAHS